MLDIRLIREKPDLVRKNLKKRREPEKLKLLDGLIKYDKRYRNSLQRLEQLRHERNIITDKVAKLRSEKKPYKKEIAKIRKIPKEIKKMEGEKEKLGKKTVSCLMRVPNLLHESVPYGKDDEDNVVVETFGKHPKFDFESKPHLEIAEGLGLIDFERAGKVTGAGFFYLKGELAMLEQAIIRYAIDFMVKKGYTLIFPPLMLRRKPYEGVVDLDDFESVMYKIDGDDLYLIATSEHPIAAMFMDEVLDLKDLPIKLCGISPCFRREIGTHGKYTKGLFRVHNFNKVEQFIFCRPDQSWKLHEELQKNANELYQGLGLRFRVMNVCTGDIGSIAAKKYDTDVWMADNHYREMGSNSNCTDYQARRLNIRYRAGEGKPPVGFVHTLNNTALATSRTMVAILEHFQQKDGSVNIPKVLWPYMNGIRTIERK
ncbi:MAG: serine--tRNA ligase [Candidatus Aenigmatarchaeota archaeon]|nr:MAG: serine--tRNA ligase [Candidatus Aenigmarchaeota archaeon]